MFDQWRIQREMGMHPTGTHSTPKLAILRSKIEEKNLWRGQSPSPNPSVARLRPHPPLTIYGSATAFGYLI